MTSVYADHDASLERQRILHERGWAAPAWPVSYGGCDWTLTQHYTFSRKRAKLFTRQRFPYQAACGASTDGKHPPHLKPHLRRFRER
jgi:hypothetical protein